MTDHAKFPRSFAVESLLTISKAQRLTRPVGNDREHRGMSFEGIEGGSDGSGEPFRTRDYWSPPAGSLVRRPLARARDRSLSADEESLGRSVMQYEQLLSPARICAVRSMETSSPSTVRNSDSSAVHSFEQ